MYQHELKIPKERIAVLIGTKGEIKKEIEEATNSRLDVDSKEGEVFIHGNDSVGLMSAKDIVKAIARGFNPEIALRLTKQDYCFEIIDLSDFTKNTKDLARVRGRIIGKEGKARKRIEELTDTNISVYGRTVGIIGNIEKVALAKQAVESLLKGSPHNKIYGRILKKNKEEARKDILEVDRIGRGRDSI